MWLLVIRCRLFVVRRDTLRLVAVYINLGPLQSKQVSLRIAAYSLQPKAYSPKLMD